MYRSFVRSSSRERVVAFQCQPTRVNETAIVHPACSFLSEDEQQKKKDIEECFGFNMD